MATRAYIERRGNGYYVAGSRVSLDSLVLAFKSGESPETIRDNFDTLRLDEVYGALTYYLSHRSPIEAYLQRQAHKWEEERRKAKSLPETLRLRLDRARGQVVTHR